MTAGPGPLALGIQVSVFLGLPLTVVAHDLIATGRVHRTTLVGVTASFVALFGALAIANSDVGAALVTALE